MRNIISLMILFIFTSYVNAQIGATKSKIIQDNENYKMDITDDGVDYISYTIEYDTYEQFVACYLTQKEKNTEQLCYKVLIIEPSSETNNWIKYFNEKNFIKLDGMNWKDYEHSIIYKIEVKEDSCIIVKYYDSKL